MKKIYKSGLILIVAMFLGLLSSSQATELPDDKGILDLKVQLRLNDVSLEEVLDRIGLLSDVEFLYSPQRIFSDKKITVNADNESLGTLLNRLLGDLNIGYEVLDGAKQILLFRIERISKLTASPQKIDARPLNLFPMERPLSGTVTDMNGEPLVGVNIVVKNKPGMGTVTDLDGKYSLEIPDGNVTLVFSYIGYQTKEVTVEGRDNVNVILSEHTEQLEEVVVVGYGTQKKENLTGAVEQVTGEMLDNRSINNVTQGLQGAMSNVNIIPSDGKPISSPTINIRGTTSIGQGGNALILIDGVEGDPSMINPDDIASISVLKDASSAAIYGARGAFGVVLISTKNADKDDFSITYSGSYGLKRPVVQPDFVTDGYTFARMFNESYKNSLNSTPKDINKSLPFSEEYLEEIKKRSEDPSLPKTWLAQDGSYRYAYNTDWFDFLYRDNIPFTDQNVAVSGNTGRASFYLSGRYQGQDGLFAYNSDIYKMYNLRGKASIDVFDWLKISNNFSFGNRKYHTPQNVSGSNSIWRNMADGTHPLAPLLNPDGTLTRSAAAGPGTYYYGKSGIDENRSFIRNTTSFEARFMDDIISIKGDFSFRNTTEDADKIRVPTPYSTAPGEISYYGASYNDFTIRNDKNNYLATNIYTEFENTFADKHYFKSTIGLNYEEESFNRFVADRNGLLFTDAENINLAFGESVNTSGSFSDWAIFGGFYRINYIFDRRYLFEFNGRYDGSSKFPENQRYGFFPSFSAGWRISEESFWKVPSNIISDFKLRASYGTLGNGNISPYAFQETFSIQKQSWILNGVQRQYTQNPGVIPEGLTWEKATTKNIGIDFGMLNGKLQFTGDAFIRETTDMFTKALTPPAVFGASTPKGNYADLKTKGWGVQLSWRDEFNVSGKAFRYSIRGVLSDHQAEITKYNNPEKYLSDYYEGMVIGELWGYESDGYFSSQEDIENHANQTKYFLPNRSDGKFRIGDSKFKDLNGNGVVEPGNETVSEPGDRRIVGNTTSRYNYGINLSVDWSNFFVSAFFQGVGKRDWYPSSEANHFWGQYNRTYNDIPRWHLNDGMIWSEENPNTFFPRYTGYIALGWRGIGNTLYTPQTAYTMNVAYIRLKSFQVGYSIPSGLVSRLGMNSFKLYLSGENIWTWSPLYKIANNIDVENITAPSDLRLTSGNSGDGLNYPMLKGLTFGVKIQF